MGGAAVGALRAPRAREQLSGRFRSAACWWRWPLATSLSARDEACREVALLACIDAARATVQPMFRQLNAGIRAEAGNPF